jgi:hypothetical protein
MFFGTGEKEKETLVETKETYKRNGRDLRAPQAEKAGISR